jgi:hypothetical protein
VRREPGSASLDENSVVVVEMVVGRVGVELAGEGGGAEFPTHILLLVRHDPEDLHVDDDHHEEWDVEGGHRGIDLVPRRTDERESCDAWEPHGTGSWLGFGIRSQKLRNEKCHE